MLNAAELKIIEQFKAQLAKKEELKATTGKRSFLCANYH